MCACTLTCILGHCSQLAPCGIELVTTTFSRDEPAMRCKAGPERTPWVIIAYICLALASCSLHDRRGKGWGRGEGLMKQIKSHPTVLVIVCCAHVCSCVCVCVYVHALLTSEQHASEYHRCRPCHQSKWLSCPAHHQQEPYWQLHWPSSSADIGSGGIDQASASTQTLFISCLSFHVSV